MTFVSLCCVETKLSSDVLFFNLTFVSLCCVETKLSSDVLLPAEIIEQLRHLLSVYKQRLDATTTEVKLQPPAQSPLPLDLRKSQGFCPKAL